jgi:hypothetical protein
VGKTSRTKGKVSERFVRNFIEEYTGVRLSRNPDQSESGGYDLKVDLSLCKTAGAKVKALAFDEWAIEIKDHKDLSVGAWWEQTVDQAIKYGRKPVLIYHVPRTANWLVVLRAADATVTGRFTGIDLVTMPLVVWLKAIGQYNKGE